MIFELDKFYKFELLHMISNITDLRSATINLQFHQLIVFSSYNFELDFVVFDNSYSYFKNKRIRYSVILTPPVSVDELEKGAATLEEKIIE